MSYVKPELFEDFYSQFYYENEIPRTIKTKYGIPLNLKTAKQKGKPTDEDKIIAKLGKGIYDSSSIAWKLGTELNDNGDINYRYFHFKADDTKKFCKLVQKCYDSSSLKTYNSNFDRKDLYKCIRDLYSEILKINIDTGLPGEKFGAVQIINSIYFLSAGKVPIYDEHAHKGILALDYKVSPLDIYLGYNNSKTDIDTVICLYKEYLMLLETVFSDKIFSTENQFIDRKLDQALWVYGHCSRNWYDIQK